MEMTFTIKCDLCGNERKIKNNDKVRDWEKVDLDILLCGDYEQYPEEIIFYCENNQCNNLVNLKY